MQIVHFAHRCCSFTHDESHSVLRATGSGGACRVGPRHPPARHVCLRRRLGPLIWHP